MLIDVDKIVDKSPHNKVRVEMTLEWLDSTRLGITELALKWLRTSPEMAFIGRPTPAKFAQFNYI